MDKEKQPKTIGEWLDWAEQNGYVWAKEARDAIVAERGESWLNEQRYSLKYVILGSFDWDEPKRGFEYWNKIYHFNWPSSTSCATFSSRAKLR